MPSPRPRFRRLEPILRAALKGPCAVPRGSRVLVAVSGGADSTALLLATHRLAPELGLKLCAAHLHHGLRGAAADQDREFVRSLCARLEVPFVSARWDTRARMRRRNLSGQAGLRTLRREYLMGVASRLGAAAIATGHTADDQLETVLLRLARGAGLPGLGGMSARSGAWIKPLLGATRAEIEADLRAAGEAWREDASNRDLRYARSRVRHEVIPALLRALGPGRAAALAGTLLGSEAKKGQAQSRAALARRVAKGAAEIRGARRMVERLAARLLPPWPEQGAARSRPSPGSSERRPERAAAQPKRSPDPPERRSKRVAPAPAEIRLDSRRLGSYPYLVQRTLFRLLWERLGQARTGGLTHRHLDALMRVVESARGRSRLDLPGGWIAEVARGSLVIRRGGKPVPAVLRPAPRRLAVPGTGRWNGTVVRTRWLSGSMARHRLRAKPAAAECFATDALHGELELRTARSDEWFLPFGRPRGQRLGEFLRRQPISAARRAHPWVLADQMGILWVIGVRRSARAPLTPDTRKALWIHAELGD